MSIENHFHGDNCTIFQVNIISEDVDFKAIPATKKKFDWKQFWKKCYQPILWLWKIIVGFINLNSS